MRKYRLTKAAEKDVADIYLYTHREFGGARADAYLDSLEASLATLGKNPQLGVDVGALRPGYRRFMHKQHAVYYQTSKPGILVVRVLGPGMAVERHLP